MIVLVCVYVFACVFACVCVYSKSVDRYNGIRGIRLGLVVGKLTAEYRSNCSSDRLIL